MSWKFCKNFPTDGSCILLGIDMVDRGVDVESKGVRCLFSFERPKETNVIWRNKLGIPASNSISPSHPGKKHYTFFESGKIVISQKGRRILF